MNVALGTLADAQPLQQGVHLDAVGLRATETSRTRPPAHQHHLLDGDREFQSIVSSWGT